MLFHSAYKSRSSGNLICIICSLYPEQKYLSSPPPTPWLLGSFPSPYQIVQRRQNDPFKHKSDLSLLSSNFPVSFSLRVKQNLLQPLCPLPTTDKISAGLHSPCTATQLALYCFLILMHLVISYFTAFAFTLCLECSAPRCFPASLRVFVQMPLTVRHPPP